MIGNPENRCCFVSDNRIHASVMGGVGRRLKEEMTRLIEQGVTHFICNTVSGLNTVAAALVVVLKNDYPDITLSFVLPCEEYSVFASKEDQNFFAGISKEVDEILYASERHTHNSIQICERFIIDNALHCICYAKNQSKAIRAMEYAQGKDKHIIDLT